MTKKSNRYRLMRITNPINNTTHFEIEKRFFRWWYKPWFNSILDEDDNFYASESRAIRVYNYLMGITKTIKERIR